MSEVTAKNTNFMNQIDAPWHAALEVLRRLAKERHLGQPGPPALFPNQNAARIAIPFQVNKERFDNNPELFIFVTLEESSLGPRELELLLRQKLSHTPFIDENHRKEITSGVWQEGDGTWHAYAISLNRSEWTLDEGRGQWNRVTDRALAA
jgi:hypothetical protein